MDCNCKCLCNTTQSKGEYVCCNCGTTVELDSATILPPCPTCGNGTYVKENYSNNKI